MSTKLIAVVVFAAAVAAGMTTLAGCAGVRSGASSGKWQSERNTPEPAPYALTGSKQSETQTRGSTRSVESIGNKVTIERYWP